MTLEECRRKLVADYEFTIEVAAQQIAAKGIPIEIARRQVREIVMSALPAKTKLFFETGRLPLAD